jgi:hypothetical protein
VKWSEGCRAGVARALLTRALASTLALLAVGGGGAFRLDGTLETNVSTLVRLLSYFKLLSRSLWEVVK